MGQFDVSKVNESGGDLETASNAGSQVSAGRRTFVSDASSVHYSTTSYRWLVLNCVFTVNWVNAAFWLTYSPISDAVQDRYGVSRNVVNMLSLCLSALYGPVVWCAAPLVKKIGFGHSVRLAALLTGLGGIVRYFGKGHSTFWLVIIGQCLSGVARPFISQLLGMVSLQWFPNHQRVLAVAIAALGNPFGIGVGMGLSPIIVKSSDTTPVPTPSPLPGAPEDFAPADGLEAYIESLFADGSGGTGDVGEEIDRLNLIHLFIGVYMMVLVAVFVRNRPKHDPSEAAITDREQEPIPFLSELKLLWNRQYWLLALAFGFGFGQINCTAVIINQLLSPFGYSRGAIGVAGVMTIIPGVFGSALVAAFLGKRPYHREALIAIYLLGGVMLQGMMLLALGENTQRDYGNFNVQLLGSAALFGFFSQPCFSVALELASETVYPASPSVSAAGVVMMGQYVGLIMSLALGHYIGDTVAGDTDQQHRVHIVGYIQSASWFVAGGLMYLFKPGNLARIQYENEQRAKKKAAKNAEKRRQRESQRVSLAPSNGTDSSAPGMQFPDGRKIAVAHTSNTIANDVPSEADERSALLQ